ncbi:MAG: hypothetical protein ACFFEA_02310 [Candidatus Thorarchaeota archaeon]
MNEWTSILKKIPLEWLTNKEDPSVRYQSLIHLLDQAPDHPDVLETRNLINSDHKVTRILSKQNPVGYWESPAEPYKPKYKASYWQIMILGMLGLDRSSPMIRRAVEHVFQFQHEEGGFTEYGEEVARRKLQNIKEKRLARNLKSILEYQWIQEKIHESQLTCLTGNVCLALIRMGYASDRRVKKALKWLVKVQNKDGGWLCPYWGAHKNDKHGCFMGTIAPLDAFSELPHQRRTPEMKKSIQVGAEFLLMHNLFRADHHEFKVINESWLKLGFPQFFYDILRGLSVICKTDFAYDRRIDEALRILLEKQQADGKWVLESSPIGRMQTNLEQKGNPSKWITFQALRVIKSVIETRGSLVLSLPP